MALSFLGDLPSTMLLRMSHERSVHVGVADFMDDGKIFGIATSQHATAFQSVDRLAAGRGGHRAALGSPAAGLPTVMSRCSRWSLCRRRHSCSLRRTRTPLLQRLGKCADPRAVLTQLRTSSSRSQSVTSSIWSCLARLRAVAAAAVGGGGDGGGVGSGGRW